MTTGEMKIEILVGIVGIFLIGLFVFSNQETAFMIHGMVGAVLVGVGLLCKIISAAQNEIIKKIGEAK